LVREDNENDGANDRQRYQAQQEHLSAYLVAETGSKTC
jgi:hypothetical protein